MSGYGYFLRLLTLSGLILAGLMGTVLFFGAIMLLSGHSISELQEMQSMGTPDLTPSMTRWLLAGQHVLVFILPALVFGWMLYRKHIWKDFDLNIAPGPRLAIYGILFLLAAYPLVNLSYMANQAIPLPDWATQMESEAASTLEAIINMPTPWIFLANLIIIGVLPGIGEELIFRGILQKQLAGWTKSPVVGIWLAALIFSAIHLQFEGFLPRLALGATLGYLYYWTGNLWVPIIAHAFNNAAQVVLIYYTGADPTSIDQQGVDNFQWWMLPLGIGGMILLYFQLRKYRNRHEPEERSPYA